MALPLIAAGVALVSTGLYLVGEKKREQDALDVLFRPPSSPPAPAAPQTKAELSQPGAWTPDKMFAASAKAWQQWTRNAIPGGGLPPPDDVASSTALWVAAGLAATAVVVFMVKR